jgi:Uma2 family endonuclease
MSAVAGSDRVRAAGSAVKLTYDDFVHFPEDGLRHELIDGEHYVSPSPDIKHQLVVGAIFTAIWNAVQPQRTGQVFVAPFDVLFSQFDVVEPDILYITQARLAQILTEKHVRGAPDLVVEVGSPGTRRRDERQKLRLYERFGVSEYWVVDTDLDLVKVNRLVDGRYVQAPELSLDQGDVLTTPLIPGLEIPLVRVFGDTDSYA